MPERQADRAAPAVLESATDELSPAQIEGIRGLLWSAFADDEDGGFTEADWEHALGGRHFLLEVDGEVVAHAAVVERELHVDDRPIRTGYVEAVATQPDRQRSGYGTIVMREVDAHIELNYNLGALGTSSHGFYERLGWQRWKGPTYVRAPAGLERTAHEDGYIMILLTRTSPPLDLSSPISCDWRAGDVW